MASAFGLLWIVVLGYLLLTGKRERKGMETFLFTRGGFGSCAVSDTSTLTASMTPWTEVDAFNLKRIGAAWHRLRIGRGGGTGVLQTICLDAGVKCDDAMAAWITGIISDRIAQSRPSIPTDAST